MNAAAGEHETSPKGTSAPASQTGLRLSSPRATYMKSGSVSANPRRLQSGRGFMAEIVGVGGATGEGKGERPIHHGGTETRRREGGRGRPLPCRPLQGWRGQRRRRVI